MDTKELEGKSLKINKWSGLDYNLNVYLYSPSVLENLLLKILQLF
jgi:hypothetical protein